MSIDNLFEKALRNGVTFAYKGTISLYDLWNLKLEQLDEIYRSLSKEAKTSEAEGEGLLATRATKASSALKLKLDIVKYVFETLAAEKDKKAKAAERKQKAQELLALISEKEGDALKGKSLEELRAQFAQLQSGEDEE
jgi:hypothetical protein